MLTIIKDSLFCQQKVGSERVSIMFIAMLVVMVMGDIVVQTQEKTQSIKFSEFVFQVVLRVVPLRSFQNCFCVQSLVLLLVFFFFFFFVQNCLSSSSIDFDCKLGCATHHCISLSSLRNPNAEKIVDCVDSCSDKCSNKN
ncbi:thionin-like protein 2 [Brassica napus]|uniref:thionin-like protein 2 n=1 Tax=Brassica napus TaxID=3708 RepID=UPI0020785BD3|nr:thionin-like protein 2 [Brassica napus]